MLFNSYAFIFWFLPVTWLLFLGLGRWRGPRAALGGLILASLFYYGWWEPRFLWLILGSMAGNYLLGRALGRYPYGWLLSAGVAANLGLLAWYKYAGFLGENLNRLTGSELNFGGSVLPLAISFFTFQQIAYLVDIRRGEAPVQDVLHYGLFVSFFPQLIAGPIVQRREMLPQFLARGTPWLRPEHLAVGLSLFLLGLFKKVVLADGVAVYAAPVFEAADRGAALTFFEAWGGALAYTYQIYFDFSGYSDMAIGLARLFGFRLPVNFNAPYQATSIIDFWRRWHMTLSRFLKYYLYIPLGGNRKGKVRQYLNLMLTMLLGGLWHGAGWNFAVWGGLHGLFLMGNLGWRSLRPRLTGLPASRPERFLGWALTFILVVLARVFFRSGSFAGAVAILQGAVGLNGAVLDARLADWLAPLSALVNFEGTHAGYFNLYGVPWLLALSAICWFLPPSQRIFAAAEAALDLKGGLWRRGTRPFFQWRPNVRWAVLTAVLGVLALSHMSRVMEFVYYQF